MAHAGHARLGCSARASALPGRPQEPPYAIELTLAPAGRPAVPPGGPRPLSEAVRRACSHPGRTVAGGWDKRAVSVRGSTRCTAMASIRSRRSGVCRISYPFTTPRHLLSY